MRGVVGYPPGDVRVEELEDAKIAELGRKINPGKVFDLTLPWNRPPRTSDRTKGAT